MPRCETASPWSGHGVDLPFLIRRAAWCFGDRIAVADGRRALTTAAAVARAECVANALDGAGVPPRACIGILADNMTAYVEADLAIALARRVRVALNARLSLDEHRYVAADCHLRVLFYSEQFRAEAETLGQEFGIDLVLLDGADAPMTFEGLAGRCSPASVARVGSPEDPAWITYTSGTTGRPKGIVLSHRSIREVALNLLLEFPVTPGELMVHTQPLSHGAAYWVLPSLISGAGVYVLRKFDPDEALAVSQWPNVRTLKCVPAMLPRLIDAGGDCAYETVIYGASPISQPVLTAALDHFGPVLVQVYGQSEAPVTITCLREEDHLGDGDERFSAGRPFRGVGVEVRGHDGRTLPPGEEGEVAVTGSHLMSGYLGMEEETATVFRDGWILTRDMGMFDERGFLRLLGRRDEMIISGGYNISPREVENVVSCFPGVEEVAVVGIPDAHWGSAVVAAVKMAPGAPATVQEVIDFARPRLTFRVPKHVTFVESIPKNAYGKVDRSKLLEQLGTPVVAAT